MTLTLRLPLAGALLAALVFSHKADADIYINNTLVRQPGVLHELVGQRVPDGSYWLLNNGNWGYAGQSSAQDNLYRMNGRRFWLGANGNWGFGGETAPRGNIFQPSPPAAPGGGKPGSYFSPGGAGGGGHFATNGRCSYISIDGMSVKTCRN